MTVCIAVACDKHSGAAPKLIMASDTLMSFGITSTDALKARGLSETWSVMMAGDDVTYAETVITTAQQLIASKSTRELRDAAFSVGRAYQIVRRNVIEEEYLSPYNLDLDSFLSKGPDFPTASKRQSVLDEIAGFDLSCTFLVAGFSPSNSNPCIFEIVNPGKYVPRSSVGYWAIGSGDINVITYLARRNQKGSTDFATSLYNAIAAKKLAEKASGVGQNTHVYILEAGINGIKWVNSPQIAQIEEMWEKEEAHVRPSNLAKRVGEIVDVKTMDVKQPKKSESGEKEQAKTGGPDV